MSCATAAAALTIWLAAAGPADLSGAGPAPPAVAQEPLFADIVRRARRLKEEAEGLRRGGRPAPADFAPAIRDLSALDMQAHVVLRERGVDGDLKCILKGIAEDLPAKLAAVEAATTPAARDAALADMVYLLNDNVEVITAPPALPA
jgi:hypothetical protein